GETYSCIIWIEDIEIEEAVEAGIDAAEMYSASNSSFVAENFMARDMSVTYVSKYSPCIFADLSATKIAELIKQSDVNSIGYWKEDNYSNASENESVHLDWDEIHENMATIRADEAQEIYNVSGAGVKIGQIEMTCPDAEYYATGMYPSDESYEIGTFYEQVEWLLSQGVNIINHSGGYSDYYNYYGQREQWMSHICSMEQE
ncbi:MAG: hypothetical protein IJ419_03105, partial [Agathobacter sp.]|nr:hypothetical protein [Agathobacter sp.]